MEKKNDLWRTIEWNWGEELDKMDSEIEQYWLNIDKEDSNIDWNKVQETSKMNFANALKNDLGKDMQNVMSGKVKVKVPFKLKVKYWFKRIFEIFS